MFANSEVHLPYWTNQTQQTAYPSYAGQKEKDEIPHN